MRKIIHVSLFVAGIMLASTTVNAQVVSTQAGGAGTTITIPNTNGSGPDLTFNPSPTNLLVASSTPSAYAINAMNTSAANGDRNEYGVWSGSTGYYQNVNASTATPPAFGVVLSATTALTATPFSAWTPIGGGGS